MERMLRIIAAAGLMAGLSLSSFSFPLGLGQRGEAASDRVPGEILVKFKPGTSGRDMADSHGRNRGRQSGAIAEIGVQVVAVPVGDEDGRVAAYRRDPSVQYAEPNVFYHVSDHPTNDTRVSDQWQYNNTGQTAGTGGADIEAFKAWHVTTGASTVKIAILDTGIDQSHEDLAAKIAGNMNFTDSLTVDDRYGHGTHVAGTAAAITNNALGVAGTCPDCSLGNVKVLNDSGSGALSWIANGITWAANNGYQVISMSLGGSSGSNTLQDAVNYAWGKGVVLVAAAGNESSSLASFPAFYSNTIAVAATDKNDAKATFSNFGSWVDVAAPGVSILSTAPDHSNRIWTFGVKYGTISGTSMATPHVAGVAGLVWASGLCPPGANGCVRQQIESRADPITGTGTWWTYGRINAFSSVAAPNVAPVAGNDAYSTGEDTPLTVPAPGVLGNDTDANGESLTAVLVGGPANGTLSLSASGAFTYAPGANFNGSDSFTYKANDGRADSNIATVGITVSPVNDAPIVANDSYSTMTGAALNVTAPGVLGNDSDPEGSAITASLGTGPTSGTLVLNADGSFSYAPNASFTGQDSFTYAASDGTLTSSLATVTIRVTGNPPVAAGDSYTTEEDTPLAVAAPGVLANDTDPEGDILTAALVSGPTKGTLSLNANGSFTYTPSANANGSDSFTYRANDGTADSNTATVAITINPANDAPSTDSKTVTTTQGAAVPVALSGSDVDTCELGFTIVTGPTSGALSGITEAACTLGSPNRDGATVTYTPNPGFTGADSFTYVVDDGLAGGNVATVSITVAQNNGVHVGDLDGTSVRLPRGFWRARVTIGIEDRGHNGQSGYLVTGTFAQKGVVVGSFSCTTTLSGRCTVDSGQLPTTDGKATFTVTSVTGVLPYESGTNHDPDGDSNGTVIQVSR